MSSWWTRRCQIVAQEDSYKQQQNCRNIESEKTNASKTKIASNKRKKNIEKAKSFEETVLVSHQFSRNSSIPNKPSEKQLYPLPQPSSSLELASVKFSSELASSSISPSSESSTSASLGVDSSEDHRDFGSFIQFKECECDSGLTIQHQGSEAFTSEKLIQHPQKLETSTQLQTIKDEHWRHLCYPLPLPPCGLSQHVQSKWIKGKLLGRGSFGHVYAGFNSYICAIKEMRSICEDQNSETCLKEMNQEVAILSQLFHRNIVQYYGSDLGKGKLSLYLEYVSGGSIHKLLQEYGPFKESLIKCYTRDIKGSNILVDPNGIIKVADFGMAKHVTSSTIVHSFQGTPHWMAPEVILNASCVGLAVDIWSLGCTIIEMATTKPPWSKYKGVAAMFKIVNSNNYPQIPSHLSEDAQFFLKLCLQRDPLLRPLADQLLQHPFIQEDI